MDIKSWRMLKALIAKRAIDGEENWVAMIRPFDYAPTETRLQRGKGRWRQLLSQAILASLAIVIIGCIFFPKNEDHLRFRSFVEYGGPTPPVKSDLIRSLWKDVNGDWFYVTEFQMFDAKVLCKTTRPQPPTRTDVGVVIKAESLGDGYWLLSTRS
jgi:hypothetical protein